MAYHYLMLGHELLMEMDQKYLVLRPRNSAIYFGNLINYSMRQLPVYCFSKRNLQELKELNSVNFQHFSFLMVHPRS